MLHFKRKYDKLETIYHYFRHFGTLSQRIKGEKNMFSRVLSAAICGIQGLPIFVEADVSEGLPGFSMVGDLSAKVKEAQDRVMTAFRNSGIQLRPKRITVNLSPADIHKDGSSYDLPVALAILAAYQLLPMETLKGVLVAGELGLNGAVKGIKGALPIVQLAKKNGCHTCILPERNRTEGEMVSDIHIVGVSTLKEVLHYLQKGTIPGKIKKDVYNIEETEIPDFADIHGQSAVRRAAEIAAGGRHHFLMMGPPGAGKSLLAKCMPGILPSLTMEESLEVSSIYSVAGLLSSQQPLIRNRPFRAPHHTISPSALAGGGRIPRPGEISLAHKGVLFLDELAEFKRETIEILRQPMEERRVHISRVYGSYVFPADCMIVAATNFCKCGNFPNLEKCICSEAEIRRYQSRISRPILDRMDISVEAVRVDYDALICEKKSEDSKTIRKRVELAGQIQRERYRDTGYRYNADLDAAGIKKYCGTGEKEKKVLRDAYEKMDLTARACHKILKVARTIADMEQKEQIAEEHLYEAIGYRIFEQRQIWR